MNVDAKNINTNTFPIASSECDKSSQTSLLFFILFVNIPYVNPFMKNNIVITNTNPELKNELYPNSLSIYNFCE